MVPASNTVKVFPELKSTAKHLVKGRKAEDRVLSYLLTQDFFLIDRNRKTPFAEIDLILKNGQSVYCVEVKTLKSWDFLPQRISKEQVRRLKRAAQYLSEKISENVLLRWAFVLPSGQVFILDDYQ